MLGDRLDLYRIMGLTVYNTPADYKDLDELFFLNEVDSLALANVQLRLESAFSDWLSGKTGKPRFKKKNLSTKAYTTNCVNHNIRLEDGCLTLKDLRNAIAHNNVIFDTRFKTGDVDQRLVSLLESEIGVSNIDFKYMDAYIIMVTYFLRKMGETKTACKQFITLYHQQTEYLRNELPINIYNQVVGTQHRPNMIAIQNFISQT